MNGTEVKPRPRSLSRSAGAFASMTLLSRILGFARDVLIAQLFGAAAGVDAFFVAFKIPNFMRRLFAEGAFSQAFVPVLAEYQKTRSKQQTRQFIGKVAGCLTLVLGLVTLLAVWGAPYVVRVFALGFEPDSLRFQLASQMLRITFPYLFFISLTAMAGAVLNTYGSFAIPAFTPVLLNIAMILAAVYLAPHLSPEITALAYGVFVAGIIQLLFQLPFLQQKGLLVRPRLGFSDPGVRRVLKLMVPAIFGVSVAQINLLLDTVFASFLPVGSVAWLFYSDRLMNLPLGVFGVAIATVILPQLSRQHAEASTDGYNKTLNWAIRSVLLIALPSALGLATLAKALFAALLAYGAFTALDVIMASKSLMAFAFGIPAFMLIKTLASGFYARQDIKTPVKVAVLALITNMVLNFLLIKPFVHAGLALATSIAAYLNAGLLAALLIKRGILALDKRWLIFLARVFVANGLMFAWLYYADVSLDSWLVWNWLNRVGHLASLISVAIVIYFSSLFLLGMRRANLRW